MTSENVRQKLERLTTPELKILALYCKGYQQKEIGNVLKYTENTIKTYMRNIRSKLDMDVGATSTQYMMEFLREYCPEVEDILKIRESGDNAISSSESTVEEFIDAGDSEPINSPSQFQQWRWFIIVLPIVGAVLVILGVFVGGFIGSSNGTQAESSPVPSNIDVGEVITCPEQNLRSGGQISCKFTSGTQETGRQEIPIGQLQPGRYTLTLQNDLPGYPGTWLVWDYLALKSEENIIWEIGNSDAPPDYTERAFAEFCDSFQRDDCAAEFFVGRTDASDFVNMLNDFDFTTEQIHFEITEQHANSDLILVLSTLFATHDDVENFQMKISLVRR